MAEHTWHELLHGAAALILSIGGAAFVAAAWRRRRSEAAPSPGATPAVRMDGGYSPAHDRFTELALAILVGSLSLGAAAIHLAAAPDHLVELGALGWGFVLAGVFQGTWALAYGLRQRRWLAAAGMAGNAAIALAWLWTRTVGLPVGPLAGHAEPIGTPDAAATLFQLLIVALLAARLAGHDLRLLHRMRDARSVLTIALVPTLGVIFLATTLAVSVAAAGEGRGHGAESHDHGGETAH